MQHKKKQGCLQSFWPELKEGQPLRQRLWEAQVLGRKPGRKKFSLGHVKFEMLIKHPIRDVTLVVNYLTGKERQAGDAGLGGISTFLVFKALRLEEIT